MADLRVTLGRLSLQNPILTASGTFGYGEEFQPYMDLTRLGGIIGKTLTQAPRKGNASPRIWETPAGMLNSIGLENKGLEYYLTNEFPQQLKRNPVAIVNIAAKNFEEFGLMADMLEARPEIAAIELNLSCPNVSEGGLDFGIDPKAIEAIVKIVKGRTKHFVIAKLTPNVSDIGVLARAAEAGGADAVSLINTLLGLSVNWRTRKPQLARGSGGLSGPAIRPVAVHMTHRAAKAVKIPVIGIGGIATADDVLEFIVAGASAVQVGTIHFVQPNAAMTILDDLDRLLDENKIESIASMTGTLQMP